MTQLSRAFSLPVAASRDPMMDVVIHSYGKATTDLFLERNAKSIREFSLGLYEYLEDWLRDSMTEHGARTMWHVSFGRAARSLQRANSSAVGVAAALGMRLAEMGYAGTWSAKLVGEPVCFGDSLMRDAREVFVNINGVSQVIGIDGTGQRREFPDAGGNATPQLPLAAPGVRTRLFPQGALVEQGAGAMSECRSVAEIGHRERQVFEDTFAFLSATSPGYLKWIERVLNGIVVGDMQPPYRSVSGSWEDVPGHVHVSCPHASVDMAEMLVHECAHQYFYMLERVGPMDDGSDPTLYWSPVIRMKRPLSRVLMAYHAIANVLLYYQEIKAAGVDDGGYVKANEPGVIEDLRVMDAPLRSSSALTDTGRAIYKPLSEAVAAWVE